MKRNLSKLILQVGTTVERQASASFKIKTKDAHKFTNKILVDGEKLEKPTSAQRFISD